MNGIIGESMTRTHAAAAKGFKPFSFRAIMRA